MTTPSDPESGEPREGVNLGKGDNRDSGSDAPFDPYRFGKPEHPIPAEYAPPGYTGPVIQPPSPYGPPPPPYGNQPYGPGPYGGQPSPYQYPYMQQPGPYGAPPPPPYHGYTQPRSGSNGKAIAGLILGIASIVLCVLSFFDGVLVVLGLIFSLIGMNETKRTGGAGRGLAVAGLICSIIGAVLATVFSVLVIHASNQCGGFSNSDQPGWDQCFRDHFG
ncbi:MAG TPA: DUF4190 domain-containing protein [Jatrophihabitans sp.]|jgi:VanZ family protein|nr:DUF4190 domain-containing protein [Jatrophihabitans sp.]